jgi:hypothetical protein
MQSPSLDGHAHAIFGQSSFNLTCFSTRNKKNINMYPGAGAIQHLMRALHFRGLTTRKVLIDLWSVVL